MFVLNNGDALRGESTNSSEVDFTIHGLDNNSLKQLASGQLSSSVGTIYTANSIDVVTAISFVNNGLGTNKINLYILPLSGTDKRLIPKDFQLLPGCSLMFEGGKIVSSGYEYIFRADSTSINETIIGCSVSGVLSSSAGWQIKKVITSSGEVNITYADGDTSFTKVWNNRLSYDYL